MLKIYPEFKNDMNKKSLMYLDSLPIFTQQCGWWKNYSGRLYWSLGRYLHLLEGVNRSSPIYHNLTCLYINDQSHLSPDYTNFRILLRTNYFIYGHVNKLVLVFILTWFVHMLEYSIIMNIIYFCMWLCMYAFWFETEHASCISISRQINLSILT